MHIVFIKKNQQQLNHLYWQLLFISGFESFLPHLIKKSQRPSPPLISPFAELLCMYHPHAKTIARDWDIFMCTTNKRQENHRIGGPNNVHDLLVTFNLVNIVLFKVNMYRGCIWNATTVYHKYQCSACVCVCAWCFIGIQIKQRNVSIFLKGYQNNGFCNKSLRPLSKEPAEPRNYYVPQLKAAFKTDFLISDTVLQKSCWKLRKSHLFKKNMKKEDTRGGNVTFSSEIKQ